MPTMPTTPSAFFFDLDHTLLKVNSSFSFGKYLYRQGFFSTVDMCKLAGLYALHKVNLLSISSLHHKIFARLFLGRSSQEFIQHAEAFIEEFLPLIANPLVIQELEKARNLGGFVAILSSSPSFLVQIIAKKINVTNWEASHYSLDENEHFSHISSLLLGHDKAEFVRIFAKEFAISLENITAYTDSFSDLPFLESAGNKVAVNPDRKLRAISVQKNWKII